MAKGNITSLHLAVEYGDERIVEALLQMSVDVNATESKLGRGPIHSAAKINHCEITKMLLDEKANVNAVSDDNLTPLHIAVANRSVRMVKLLLDYGADVNPKKKFFDKTPLYIAVEYDCPEIADMLLRRGASMEDAVIRNTNLFDVARRIHSERMFRLLLQYATLRVKSRIDAVGYKVIKDKFGVTKHIKKETLLIRLLKRNALKSATRNLSFPMSPR